VDSEAPAKGGAPVRSSDDGDDTGIEVQITFHQGRMIYVHCFGFEKGMKVIIDGELIS